jgi:hypothetical protein
VRDPAKYNWNPKQLLTQICSVYLNLYRADKQGVFAAAIAADARSYRPQMFAEASHVLRQFQLMSETEVGDSSVLLIMLRLDAHMLVCTVWLSGPVVQFMSCCTGWDRVCCWAAGGHAECHWLDFPIRERL